MTRFLRLRAGEPEQRQPGPGERRRSVYEDLDPAVFGDSDEVEKGWRRIGELDPATGVWFDGPRWHEALPVGVDGFRGVR